jgi:hypothetical protein
MLAERADAEGWPAARFLAALAEVEIAERETRRGTPPKTRNACKCASNSISWVCSR